MSPRRRLLLLVIVAMVAVLSVGGTIALRSDDPTDATVGAGVEQVAVGPVVLVPGYGGGTSGLQALAQQLQAQGRSTRVVTLPGDATGDLRAQADALDAAIQPLLDGGAPSVDLVGYSAGGVVVRLWFDRHDGGSKARRVVTLGSPHHGTSLAALASGFARESCPAACQQLVPDSDLLRDLNSDESPAGPVWTSVWTRLDEVVTPPESARLDGAVNVVVQDVCPDATTEHGQLPTDPLVQGIVTQSLGSGTAPTAFPASGCAALRGLG